MNSYQSAYVWMRYHKDSHPGAALLWNQYKRIKGTGRINTAYRQELARQVSILRRSIEDDTATKMSKAVEKRADDIIKDLQNLTPPEPEPVKPVKVKSGIKGVPARKPKDYKEPKTKKVKQVFKPVPAQPPPEFKVKKPPAKPEQKFINDTDQKKDLIKSLEDDIKVYKDLINRVKSDTMKALYKKRIKQIQDTLADLNA